MVNFKRTIVYNTYLLTLFQTTQCKNHCPGSLKKTLCPALNFNIIPRLFLPLLHLHIGLCDAH